MSDDLIRMAKDYAELIELADEAADLLAPSIFSADIELAEKLRKAVRKGKHE